MDRAVLGDHVYAAIRSMILANELEPGVRLKQQEIAEMLGVSRTPVQSAFSRLERELLLVSKPNCGVMVRRVTLEDYLQLTLIRLRLEPLGAYQAARNATEGDIAALESILDDFSDATGRDDTERQKAADYEFHMKIHEASRNPFLLQILTSMNMISFSNIRGLFTDPRISLEAHLAIHNAIRSHDPAGAEQAMQGHLEATKNRLLARMKARAGVDREAPRFFEERQTG
jgi:DNA-binding GntR family transcriptional regulator